MDGGWTRMDTDFCPRNTRKARNHDSPKRKDVARRSRRNRRENKGSERRPWRPGDALALEIGLLLSAFANFAFFARHFTRRTNPLTGLQDGKMDLEKLGSATAPVAAVGASPTAPWV